MAKLPSSVNVLAQKPTAGGKGSYYSVDVEKIDNGWLKTTCKEDGAGYKRTKEFCAEEPSATASLKPSQSSTLKDAVKCLKGK